MKNFWIGLVNFGKWVWYSSENAEQISLTVRSTFMAAVPALVIFFKLTNVHLDSAILTTIIDGICTAIVWVGGVISALGFAIGFIRKLWSTITGNNAVIASFHNSDY